VRGGTLMRIDHFGIGASDLDATVAWYRDVIGLAQFAAVEGRHLLGCGGRASFDLVIEPGGPGLRHVAYACFSDAEFAAATGRLERSGLTEVPVAFCGPGVRAARAVALPGGHIVQVIQRAVDDHYLRVADWAPAAAHSPRDIDHVNIAVRDVDASVDALSRALGLRLSDLHHVGERGNVGAWMRAGERHHDFAIIANKADGLHHLAYQLPDAAALVMFADRLAAAGSTAEYGIGRHSPGSNLFLYARDPSGNRLELTADMALVPDTARHRVWEGTDPSIVNTLAPYVPPRAFWEIT
jgi:catechol 2,3-dioxygenase